MNSDYTPAQSVPALKLYTIMMRASNTVTERLHHHLSDHNLTISQFGVMEALYHLGAMCQKDIGLKILKTSGNITLVIDNLEKRKLVKRKPNPDDRRKIMVELTQSGASLVKKIFPDHSTMAESIFNVLTSREQDELAKLLKKLGIQDQ